MNIHVTPDGKLRFLAVPQLQPLSGLGRAEMRRASHIVPQSTVLRVLFRLLRSCVPDDSRCAEWTRRWRCQWLADLRISDGPILGPFPVRHQALAAELDWLTQHGF